MKRLRSDGRVTEALGLSPHLLGGLLLGLGFCQRALVLALGLVLGLGCVLEFSLGLGGGLPDLVAGLGLCDGFPGDLHTLGSLLGLGLLSRPLLLDLGGELAGL